LPPPALLSGKPDLPKHVRRFVLEQSIEVPAGASASCVHLFQDDHGAHQPTTFWIHVAKALAILHGIVVSDVAGRLVELVEIYASAVRSKS
jgi:hypothetical protein